MVGDGLGDDVDRVRVVEDPRARAGDRDVVEDLPHDVDRAQGHEEAARALRLLADHAVRERDALVEHARLEAAGPVARQDRVAAVEAGAAVGRRRHGEVEALRGRHPLGEAADQLEPLGVEVDQHDLGPVEVGALLDEAGHRARRAGGSAADVGDLQSCHGRFQATTGAARARRRGSRRAPRPRPRAPAFSARDSRANGSTSTTSRSPARSCDHTPATRPSTSSTGDSQPCGR